MEDKIVKYTFLNILIVSSFLFVGCGSDDDKSTYNKSTYTTCKITNSTALLAENRERDERQCWSDGSQTDKTKALTWCTNKAYDYCNAQYMICDQALSVQVSDKGC
ncbi:MAG: hypothetical protein B1H07_02180 [Campylobacteraceae bacterium 4484_166]|nr:MAG: hypothetical protein B1H07_02180 [Campylobacteraceae bacterium 4484_166]